MNVEVSNIFTEFDVRYKQYDTYNAPFTAACFFNKGPFEQWFGKTIISTKT